MSINILTYSEHEMQTPIKESISFQESAYDGYFHKIHRGRKLDHACFQIQKDSVGETFFIDSSYFVGLSWLDQGKSALFIQPKLNKQGQQIDLFQMVSQALEHTAVASEIDQLFQIDWNAPTIPVGKQADFFTPFLSITYLNLLKSIVRKGLRKAHRRVRKNLQARVKGKILVSESIRRNIAKQKASYTVCDYPEHGINTPENAILKKALSVVKKNLSGHLQQEDQLAFANTLNYLGTNFKKVKLQVDIKTFQPIHNSPFHKEYGMALQIAQMIIKQAEADLNINHSGQINLPPFWIDMSKLFELYVLGLLKDRFHEQVQYQVKYRGGELDYLLDADPYKMVIDAKYKPIYRKSKLKEDIRQISAYARLKRVRQSLNIAANQVVDCLVVYPNQENGWEHLSEINLKATPIRDYSHFYKVGIKLPLRENTHNNKIIN